jgi:hypothetical protein
MLGHKNRITKDTLTESLTDLHDGAKWIGIRVACPKEQTVTVTLTSTGNVETWTQSTNILHLFPSPFPSWMAKEMDLHITVAKEDATLMSVFVVFQEDESKSY